MNFRSISRLLLTFLISAIVAHAVAAAEIGVVDDIRNDVFVKRDNREIAAEPGTRIHENDLLVTSSDGRVHVIFTDGTRLALGGDSRLRIDRFVYAPDQGLASMLLESLGGPFRFVTGQLGKVASRTVVANTPVATIGIRGTDFWSGPLRGTYSMLLVEGAVEIRNTAGVRILDTPGQGVDIAGPDVEPGEVRVWPQDKVDEALGSVSLN